MSEVKELDKKAVLVWRRTVEVVGNASGGHIGGSLSSVDILVALHFAIMNIDPKNPVMKGRDRFILSMGHSVESYYSTLESRGFITSEMLDTYGQFNSIFAGHYKLSNLVAIIDRNHLQISGRTEEVCAVDDLEGKYRACGWNVVYCNGHDMSELIYVLKNAKLSEKPTLVIAHTVKGKGVSFMENRAGWHHKVPSKEQPGQAFAELDKQMEDIENG